MKRTIAQSKIPPNATWAETLPPLSNPLRRIGLSPSKDNHLSPRRVAQKQCHQAFDGSRSHATPKSPNGNGKPALSGLDLIGRHIIAQIDRPRCNEWLWKRMIVIA